MLADKVYLMETFSEENLSVDEKIIALTSSMSYVVIENFFLQYELVNLKSGKH